MFRYLNVYISELLKYEYIIIFKYQNNLDIEIFKYNNDENIDIIRIFKYYNTMICK